MFEGIKIMLSMAIPNKWNGGAKESEKPMHNGHIVKHEPMKEVGFALKDL